MQENPAFNIDHESILLQDDEQHVVRMMNPHGQALRSTPVLDPNQDHFFYEEMYCSSSQSLN